MTVEVSAKEFADLKRRVELAETKLAQHTGQFEFLTGQLRDIQLYMHAKFADVDARFDKLEATFDAREAKVDVQFAELNAKFDALPRVIAELNAKVDALPRVIAEMISKR